MPPASYHIVLLAFGANLGDPRSQILEAWGHVLEIPGVKGQGLSSLYATMPIGGPKNQPIFLNCAGIIQTDLSPLQLLAKTQAIETKMGRIREEHWGPRVIDIDIILFGNAVINSSELTIPHPLMHERSFVLDPAAEIASEMVHPLLRKSVAELRKMLYEKIRR